jgi:Zn-dependent peptidase ImmA (M78 family)
LTLRRGFRAEAERHATQIRGALGLTDDDRLDVVDAAAHLDVAVVSASDLVDAKRLEELERLQAFAFSACTFEIGGKNIIVFNPVRSEARRVSDVAHELSHIILKHQLTEFREVAGIPFRTCRADQEEEATTLGGALLLPRALLLRAAQRGMDVEEIAKAYGVTPEMAKFRYNTTGVARQLTRSRTAKGDTG